MALSGICRNWVNNYTHFTVASMSILVSSLDFSVLLPQVLHDLPWSSGASRLHGLTCLLLASSPMSRMWVSTINLYYSGCSSMQMHA
jgi:hypothetical protein